ncbi:MAG: MATE family efflux transporter [Lachnospiraceae bacterium]|nr:MATE family efflux transporter [Lachnospiraceae bacterium]
METENELQKKQFGRMTTEPVGKLLFTLSVPTIISMMVTNIYNLVDTAFVGTLGTSESAATGIVFGYMAILQAVAFMCGQGSGSIMSRKLGARELEEATKYSSTGFFLSFTLGLIMAVLSFVFMKPLLYLLGSTETIAPYAGTYIFYILLSAPFFTSSLTMNNLLRYEGKAKLGTIGLMIGAVINIFGDMILLFGLKLGIAGAGIATAVSQVISFSILLSMFLRGKTQTRISVKYVARDFKTVWIVVATGFPSLLRQSLNSVATMLLNKTSGVYGDEAVAAMSIVSRISFFPMAVAIGIGQGFQPISSFNFGANKKERVRKAFWSAFAGAECVLTLISVPIYIFAGMLVQQLRDDPKVIELGIRALRLMCIGQLFVPLTMMVEMGFQSIGEKLLASFASCLRSGLLFIPTLLILKNIRGISGVQEAQPLSFVFSFIVCLFLCRIYLKHLRE